jgi:predicted ribosome quality control (RQC) complex YloA/Tae2 family protein
MKEIQLHQYHLAGGWTILAGKTDADNDELSLKIAKQNDTWFHVRGCPGSHVILHSDLGNRPGRELLRTAAAVAAWHSKARRGNKVPVSFTLAKYVSKPKKAEPGSVIIRNDRVLIVKPSIPVQEEKL